MGKEKHLILLLILFLTLSACSGVSGESVQNTTEQVLESEITEQETAGTTEPQRVSAEIENSVWSLPDCTAQQLTEYFEEVVLNVEYTDGTGNDDLVKKWLSPIYYQIYGKPTDADREVLEKLCEQLNVIPGFPGIYPAEDAGQENVSISFLDPASFRDSFSDVINGEEAYGAAQFWFYTLTNELHTARIGCRTDANQTIRNAVLMEEIINVLGISDTVLRADSITYQYSDENKALSEIDLFILKILYHPSVECGMDADSCAAIIQQIYDSIEN